MLQEAFQSQKLKENKYEISIRDMHAHIDGGAKSSYPHREVLNRQQPIN